MTNGMKSGAGSDPFADNSDESDETATESDESKQESRKEADSEGASTVASEASPTHVEQSVETDSNSMDRLPYIFQRNGVKDERKMIQYFLREETQTTETNARSVVEEELGTDVHLTDLREALVRVGADHLDEVADELRDWGYRFREE